MKFVGAGNTIVNLEHVRVAEFEPMAELADGEHGTKVVGPLITLRMTGDATERLGGDAARHVWEALRELAGAPRDPSGGDAGPRNPDAGFGP